MRRRCNPARPSSILKCSTRTSRVLRRRRIRSRNFIRSPIRNLTHNPIRNLVRSRTPRPRRIPPLPLITTIMTTSSNRTLAA
jgi:hypothetical protein